VFRLRSRIDCSIAASVAGLPLLPNAEGEEAS
jgi:hypothetical protein